MMFSSGTPKLSSILVIAAVIIAGAIEGAGVNIHQGLAYAGEMLR